MSTEPLTPTTDAGRRVLAALEAVDATNPKAAEAPIGWWQAVVAIELEARQQGLDAARAAQDVAGREEYRGTRAEHDRQSSLGLHLFDESCIFCQPVTPPPDALREVAQSYVDAVYACSLNQDAPPWAVERFDRLTAALRAQGVAPTEEERQHDQ
jgi:hypothetical protein